MLLSKPTVFIASSKEGLSIATAIKEVLDAMTDVEIHSTIWTDPGIFNPSEFPIEALENAIEECCYAIMVMTPEDEVDSRGERYKVPRDNLVLEWGLFAGKHGRRSVFIVTPYNESIKVPSDLLGLTRCIYRPEGVGGRPDVTSACSQIVRAIKNAERNRLTASKTIPKPGKFWSGLSDRIVILYGIEHTADIGRKGRSSVSQRDLETAHQVFGFLNRCYPEKVISLFPAETPEWQQSVGRDADVVTIGGFITNKVFRRHRSLFEHNYRVTTGRLCVIADEDRRIVWPDFVDAQGKPLQILDPQTIEDTPSKFVSRDYGLVTSSSMDIYDSIRRVITISGIKGHGTHGAAKALTREAHQSDLEAVLPRSLTGHEQIEIVVAADVIDNYVTRTEILELMVNNNSIKRRNEIWKTCQPLHKCACHTPARVASTSRDHFFRAIVFDLDDTLVDTYTCLIKPLEDLAARRMVLAGLGESEPALVTQKLVQLRVRHPDNMEEFIQGFPGITKRAIEEWRSVYSELSLDKIRSLNEIQDQNQKLNARLTDYQLGSQVQEMLRTLGGSYDLHLLTAGSQAYQSEKIKYLNLDEFFDDERTMILSSGSEETKENRLKQLVEQWGYLPGTVVVVGNRLDHEIRAGNKLGMFTVWVNWGEGSSMEQGKLDGPNAKIDNLTELSELAIKLPDLLNDMETYYANQP